MRRLQRPGILLDGMALFLLCALTFGQEPAPKRDLGLPGDTAPKATRKMPVLPARKKTGVVQEPPHEALRKRLDRVRKLPGGGPDPREAMLQHEMWQQAQNSVEQLTARIRPMLAGQFHLLRTACAPSEEQLHAIAREALQGVRASAEAAAFSRLNRKDIKVPARVPNAPTNFMDFNENAVFFVALAAKNHLSPQQLEAYQAACDARTEFRKQAALDNMVANLDAKLSLTTAQREALRNSLASHWQPGWGQPLLTYLSADRSVPRIPDGAVMPLLDEAQKKLWKTSIRQGNYVAGSYLLNSKPMDDEILSAEIARDEAEAQKKRAEQDAP